MPVLTISHDPAGLRLTGGTTIDFANSISYATGDILQSFNNLLSTTQPANSPVFGGIEDSSLGNASYAYNSGPFGNCGLLNGVGAAYLSYTFGADFRYRYSTAGHVITEIDFGDGWHVVESYGRYGAYHLVDQGASPGQNPFYTLSELQDALHNGDPASIWLDVPTAIRDYYGDSGAVVVDPMPTDPTFTNSHWSSTTFTLASNEQATLALANYTLSDLYGMGAVAPLDTAAPAGFTSATLTRGLSGASSVEHIETSFAVTDVKLQVLAGADSVPSYFPVMAYDAVKIFPVAPEGTIALPGFTPGAAQDWTGQWILTSGQLFETPRGGILSHPSGGVTRLSWNQPFTNSSASPVQVWIPVAFRTDAPSSEHSGATGPLAVLRVGDQSIAIDATDRDLHYRDVLVTVPASSTVALSLDIAAGRSMQLLALGTGIDLAGILSAENPALAVDVDVSGVGSLLDFVEMRVALTGQDAGPPTGLEAGDLLDVPAATPPPGLRAYSLNELAVTRSDLAAAGDVETIETPYLITNIDLLASSSGFDIEAAREAIRVFAAPPSWSVAAPGFERGAEQEWLADWSVTRGAARDTGVGVVVYNPDGTYAELHSSQSYTNTTTEQQFLWFPIAYRTDTPSRPADGLPVATLVLGEQWFNFYATDLDLHYKGVIVSVEPGATVQPAFYVYGGKTIEVYALGTSIDISEFISPENPVQAVDVDFSQLAAIGLGDYRAHVDLSYALMVNPYLSDERLTGGSADDTLVGSSAENYIEGGSGADFLDGSAGVDRLLGGEGNDTIVWDASDDHANVRGGAGIDTLIGTGQRPASFDLAAHEFERALFTYTDDTHTASWTTITSEYLPGWVLSTQRGTYVAGGSWLTRYEFADSEFWDYSIEYFDGLGRATGNYVHADDGTSYGTVVDIADEHAFAYYVNYLDAQSRQIGIQFAQDDGSVYGVNYDAAHQYAWTSSANTFDALGHLISAQTRYDDGRLVSERIDTNDEYSWATLADFIDAYGRLKAQGVHFDDGSSAATYFDVDDQHAWQFETFEFDANGQLIDHSYG